VQAPRVALVSAANYWGEASAASAIMSVFGPNLATTTETPTQGLPPTLGGTAVTVFDRDGVSHAAPLFFVSPHQVNFLMPPDLPAGPATVRVTSGDGTLSTITTEVVNVTPGLFSVDATGQGLAVALVLRVKEDGTQSYEPVANYDAEQKRFVARPIDLGPETDQLYLVLFGTGIRGRRDSPPTVRARIGSMTVKVLYAGAQNDYVGLDQVNLRIPRALAGSGGVSVDLIVDSVSANPVQVVIR
jgi:uncharacterized protein (TIGR03437 family)